MNIVFSNYQTGRWYDKFGVPTNTIEQTNGSFKKTTLWDARKLGLYPSLTTKLKIKSNEHLEKYKIEQAILSSLTLPRIEGESDDSFAKRIAVDYLEGANKSAQLGTDIHYAIESYVNDKYYNESMDGYVKAYKDWFRDQIKYSNNNKNIQSERVYVNHEMQYGCTVDLTFEDDKYFYIIDFKSQNIKGDKPNYYSSWLEQLVGCELAIRSNKYINKEFKLINLVFDVNPQEDGSIKIYEKQYKRKQIEKAEKSFRALNHLYNIDKRIEKECKCFDELVYKEAV